MPSDHDADGAVEGLPRFCPLLAASDVETVVGGRRRGSGDDSPSTSMSAAPGGTLSRSGSVSSLEKAATTRRQRFGLRADPWSSSLSDSPGEEVLTPLRAGAPAS